MTELHNVRDALSGIIGKKIIDITQEEWSDVAARGPFHPQGQFITVYLHLEDGSTVTFYSHLGQGFGYDGQASPSENHVG